MSGDKLPQSSPHVCASGCDCGDSHGPTRVTQEGDPQNREEGADISRRGFLGGTAFGIAAATSVAATMMTGQGVDAAPPDHVGQKGPPPHAGNKNRVLLKGGIVLSLDPAVGDFERADVLVEGKKIVAVQPNINAHARVVDCKGMIVMPGFVNTHHHQYQTLARGIIADGVHIRGSQWPLQTYSSIVQDHWTSGRATTPSGDVVLELGGSPLRPEDNYISELVASLSQINAGVTTGVDTSQASHSPEYTDAMIQGIIDSGRRTLFAYSGGRSDTPGYEYPGAIGNTTSGIGRLKTTYFSSDDQVVKLGLGGGINASSIQLARHFEAPVIAHSFDSANAAALAANEALLGDDITLIHTTRYSDATYAIIARTGCHVSLAVPIEMQMQHGMPPIQQAREHGILPSLSSDTEANMTADMFTIMRHAFNLQRALMNERVIRENDPSLMAKLVTCEEVLRMATIAGAKAAGFGDKVGSLTPGKEADIIVLDATRINCMPLNNVHGAVVTLMDTSNVRHVMIAGEFKKWEFELIGWNEDKLRREIEKSRDRVLATLKAGNPAYLAPFIGSCCSHSYQGL